MSMIWLVGTSDEWLEGVASVLSGFFAVRRIGSLKNFGRLITLGETPKAEPFFCVVRIAPSDDLISIFSAFSSFGREFRANQLCVLGDLSADQRKVVENFRVAILGTPQDLVQTAKLLRRLMAPAKTQPVRPLGDEILRIGDLEIDRSTSLMRVIATGVEEALTPKEVRIIFVLSGSVNQSISREELIKKVWSGTHVSASTVDSHMSRLRKKIDQSFECRLETQYGSGWVLSLRSDMG
jgi:Transcriptional regulatory protein, C terminal